LTPYSFNVILHAMTESEVGQQAAGELSEKLISTTPPDLAIYLSTNEVHKVTIKKKRIKDADGKKKKMRIIKVNPPCDAMMDEPIGEILSHKKPGIRFTEEQFLETAMWLRANRDSFINNDALDFGQINQGLHAIQKKLGIRPIKPTRSLPSKPAV
jgi:hypothetical protein